jgi:putative hydrolase of the HAD superfamily
VLTKSDWDSIDGVVFDAVGTLIEPFPAVADAYAQAALRQGVVLPAAEVKARFRTHFQNDEWDEIRGPLATDEAAEERRWRRIVRNVLPEVPDFERAFGELWDHFGSPAAWRCFPEVGAVLDALEAAGRSVCVASNFDARLRRVAAGLPELAGRVDRIVISSEVGCRKPHPDFYRAACRRLALEPGRVLCVGDDLENDVEGPARAGVRGLWLDRRGESGPQRRAIGDLTELVRALGTGTGGRP